MELNQSPQDHSFFPDFDKSSGKKEGIGRQNDQSFGRRRPAPHGSQVLYFETSQNAQNNGPLVQELEKLLPHVKKIIERVNDVN